MRGRRLAILGDSNSRYHSFNINRFLETCDVGPLDYDKWGEDGDWDDKNGNVYWTNNWGRSGSGSHLQGPMCMDFKEYKAKTCYWFLQSTWNSRMDPNFYTKLPGLVKTIQDDFDLARLAAFETGRVDAAASTRIGRRRNSRVADGARCDVRRGTEAGRRSSCPGVDASLR